MTNDPYRSSRSDACVSDLTLDRLAVGELAGPDGASAREHVAGCAACSARALELERNAEQLPREAWIGDAIQRTTREVSRPRVAGVAAVVAMAAGIALVLWLGRGSGEDERVKGPGVNLQLVARDAAGHVARVLPGASLAPGDAIRFEVSSARDGYLGIVAMDSNHAVTSYVPAAGALVPFSRARARMLDGSIVLDETPGIERLVAVVCAEPRATETIMAAAKHALDLTGGDPSKVGDLDVDCSQASFVFAKAPR